jgi:predicted metal-binding membrane protein
VLGAVLLILTALAWFQLVGGGLAAEMASHHAHAGAGLMHPQPHACGPRELGMVFLMWLLMAVAMMLPTVAPAILAFADVVRAGYQTAAARARVGAFLLGYLSAWWGFGVFATAAQWGLTAVALRVSALNAQGALVGGTLPSRRRALSVLGIEGSLSHSVP